MSTFVNGPLLPAFLLGVFLPLGHLALHTNKVHDRTIRVMQRRHEKLVPKGRPIRFIVQEARLYVIE